MKIKANGIHGRRHRQLFFVDDPAPGKGGRRIASLDLESGEINRAMDVDEDAMYLGLFHVANDGEFGLVS